MRPVTARSDVDHHGAQGDRRHEVAVHDVHVDDVGIRLDQLDLVAEVGEVGGQYRCGEPAHRGVSYPPPHGETPQAARSTAATNIPSDPWRCGQSRCRSAGPSGPSVRSGSERQGRARAARPAPRRSRPWDRCTPRRRAARPGERARRQRARSRAAVPRGPRRHPCARATAAPDAAAPIRGRCRARRRGRGRRSRPRAAVAARRARSSTEPSSTARPGAPIRAALRSWTSPATTRPSAPTSETIMRDFPPGAAQTSATSSPGLGSRARTTNTLAWSWTAKAPERNPGRVERSPRARRRHEDRRAPVRPSGPRPRRSASSAAGSSARRLSGAWAARASAAGGVSSTDDGAELAHGPEGQAGTKAQGRVVVPHGPGRPIDRPAVEGPR